MVSRGQCCVKWEVLCSPREVGGLRIRRLRDFNISLVHMMVKTSDKPPISLG